MKQVVGDDSDARTKHSYEEEMNRLVGSLLRETAMTLCTADVGIASV